MQKWDACISSSVNGLPYALSWWLNTVNPSWEALIMDDYRFVMPLTCSKKLGFHFLFQPFLTQQLGIFSDEPVSTETVNLFLLAIPPKYKYTEIQLNASNNPGLAEFSIYKRNSFILDLSKDYIVISSSYHRNCRRNIQKAINAGLKADTGPGPAVFTRFIQRNLENSHKKIPHKIYPLMQQLIQLSIQLQSGEVTGIYNRDRELVAAGWFLTVPGRILFLVCGSTAAGKENQAMYMLVDDMIRKKAGTRALFDFTGSDMPGVAYFNSGFGAMNVPYPAVKRNDLPLLIKLLKR